MSSRRQLVQYDDLEQSNSASSSAAAIRPPSKKRKRSNQKTQHPRKTAHRDDTGDLTSQINYDDDDGDQPEDGEIGVAEESRELTYEEIWDDSALIDAWNSATSEYETFHGKSQEWKSESKPVKKSPLWYNTPRNNSSKEEENAKEPSSTKLDSAEAPSQAAAEDQEDSALLDFDTFVPSYDPSFPVSSEPPAATQPSFFVPAPSTTMVSRDEAFNRALSAMYWGGYWTAVYHCQTQHPSQGVGGEEDQEYEDGDEEASEDDDPEDLVPAQR